MPAVWICLVDELTARFASRAVMTGIDASIFDVLVEWCVLLVGEVCGLHANQALVVQL